jgi:hypothetical protein
MRVILARLAPAITLLPLTLLVSAKSALAETLKTQNFSVTITRNCPEGSVTCNDVTYVGHDLNTGESIRLKGKTMQHLCADRLTPCRFLGYEFRNRNYRYVVTVDGNLQVYRDTKLLLDEQGTWGYED